MALRRPYWRLGVTGAWEDIQLLTKGELMELFGGAVYPERVGPLGFVWTWTVVPVVEDQGHATQSHW